MRKSKSKQYLRSVILDIKNTNCPEEIEARLLYIFENLMKKCSALLADRMEFDLSNFSYAEKKGITGFRLEMKRMTILELDHWTGSFKRNNQELIVFGLLEYDKC